MLNQKPSTSVDETALEHLLDKSRDITELITVATLLGDTQVLLDLQAKLLKKLKNEFEDMLESRNLSELFGAAFILSKQDHAFMDGQLVARLVTLLTQSEVALGGPYTSKNGKSDLITNIFIALFLQSQDVKLSNLTTYIWSQLEDDTFFKNSSERSIILYFASHLNEADSSLLKKLAVDVYLLEPEYGVLLDCMRLKINGTNEIFSEVVEPSEKSNMITIVSALVRGDFVKTQNSNLKLYSKNYADQVYKIVSEESQLHREPLRSYLIKIEDKIRNADKGGEISLLARYFADALRVPSASVGSNDLNMLGAANVFCWAAYTLYDDFIDGEGQIKYLSIANSAMRKSLTLLRGVFKFEEQHSLIEFLFDCMDQANAWELQETRFTVTESNIFITEIPNYGDLSILSNRAAGHIIAPLCLAIQYSFTHEQQQLLRQALHHYLVARQLNDDMHDWSEDVKNGHCTYVVSCMLRGAKITSGKYSHSELNNLLKIYFWKHGFEELSHRALAHIELSKRSFAKTKKFNEDSKFFQFLNSIESSVREARLRFVQKQEFLKEFKQAN